MIVQRGLCVWEQSSADRPILYSSFWKALIQDRHINFLPVFELIVLHQPLSCRKLHKLMHFEIIFVCSCLDKAEAGQHVDVVIKIGASTFAPCVFVHKKRFWDALPVKHAYQ